MRKGLFVVFTGNGKGKTTAAVGTALRALGHGCRVCLIQFVKGSWKSGELEALGRFSDLLDVHVLGKGFMFSCEEIERNREVAHRAWECARRIIASSTYDLVVLDELTYLIHFDLIDEGDVLQVISKRPAGMHVIVTGRHASDGLVAIADLVTEMREIKHPMNGGISCQKGIEF
ncbi:MAG: cob(I)yrinic acid a,c-diamide adenosyltransferase [Spirochaetes bacterium DG_61]|jgi:cob(I)alamin adenosyltransferase|nr:MAG: cob(I)yrinic acid a,c-diamide adenosyltransferase [Spirochaetes bacterium DG_61]